MTWKKSIAQKGKKVKLRWKKVSGAEGYQITVADNKRFTHAWNRRVKKNTTIVKKKSTIRYVKVRAYKLDADGNRVYGRYSRIKKIF